jgi:hypothetical protein
MPEIVEFAGFVRLINALSSDIDGAPICEGDGPLSEVRFTLGTDAFALDVPGERRDWVIETPEPSCTVLASANGSVTHFWREHSMRRIPLYSNGEAMRLTIFSMPFLVWHIAPAGESRQAARICGFVTPKQVLSVDVIAPSEQELRLMFRVLRSARRAR